MRYIMSARYTMSFLFATVLLHASINADAQSKLAFEQYNYIRQPDAAVFVPIVRLETNNNWHLETRYNYEDAATLSVFAGKTFTGGKDVEFSITPMAGLSSGTFTGVSFGTTTEASWKKIYLWAQSQYSKATKKNTADFFFNWSELGYDISDRFFAGAAMQYTRQTGLNVFEPGLLGGVNYKKFSFPFYVFKPFSSGSYFVLGINYEYTMKKKS
jgi:hypothetical protein